jgi:hypothetical protein
MKLIRFLFYYTAEYYEAYQLKIFGLQTHWTQNDLARKLHVKDYQIMLKPQLRISYIIKLKTFHFAKELMKEWHNKDVGDGETWRCQIELYRKSIISTASSKPPLLEKEDSKRFSSDDDNDVNSEPRTVSDQDMNCEGRLFAHCYDLLIKQKESDNRLKVQSRETVDSSDHRKCKLIFYIELHFRLDTCNELSSVCFKSQRTRRAQGER